MAELEIELQYRPEYFRVTEDNKQLKRLYGPGYTGLDNIGNSCYMNSVLQVLFSIPEFSERYFQNAERFFSESGNNAPDDFHAQISKVAVGLLSGEYSHEPQENEYEKHIRPYMFKKVAAAGNREFSTGHQQDALEYFQYILSQIERREHAKGEGQNPSNAFMFEVEERYQCSESLKVKYTKRKDNQISLIVPIEKARNLEQVRAYQERHSKKSKEQILEEKHNGTLEEPIFPIVSFQDCLQEFSKPEEIFGFYSSALKRNTTAFKTTRIANFPKYLVFKSNLFHLGEGWTPQKLDVEIDVPEEIDINWLRGTGKSSSEELLPDENEEKNSFKESDIEQLMAIGFTKTQAERALFTNDGNLEAGANWLMMNMDNPIINEPLPKKKGGSSNKKSADPSLISELMSMGFTSERASYALQTTDNSMERAVDWLFNHMEDPIPTETNEEVNQEETTASPYSDGFGVYELVAFINHIGSSSQSGHYICHIKKEGKWIKYNDDKVEESLSPPIQFGYLHFFQRKN